MNKFKKLGAHPHLVIWIVIGVIFIGAVVRLLIWNVGTKSTYDPDNIAEGFEREALDTIYKVDTSKIEGFVDDSVTTVLMVGNNPISDKSGTGSIASLVAGQTKAEVFSAGFSDSCLAAKYSVFSEDCPVDAFSLYYLTKAMCDGDYSLQDNFIQNGTVNADYNASLDVLKGMDYSKVDVLVFFYDARDYLQTRNLYDENDDYNTGTYTGALRASAKQIKAAYPHIRMILMSPYFASFVEEDGTYSSGDTKNLGCGVIPNYLQFSIDVGNECLFTVIDNYYGSIFEEIAPQYLTDNIHLNDKGRELLAKRLAETIGIPE